MVDTLRQGTFHRPVTSQGLILGREGVPVGEKVVNEQDCLSVDSMVPCLIKHLTAWAVECMNAWVAMFAVESSRCLTVMGISDSALGKCTFPIMSTVSHILEPFHPANASSRRHSRQLTPRLLSRSTYVAVVAS